MALPRATNIKEGDRVRTLCFPKDGVVVTPSWTPNFGTPDDCKTLWRLGNEVRQSSGDGDTVPIRKADRKVLIKILWSKEPRAHLASEPGIYVLVSKRVVREA